MADKKEKPDLEWWTKLAGNLVTLNAPGVAVSIAKIPKFFKREEEIDETEAALREHMNGVLEKVSCPLPIEPDLSLWGIYVAQGAKRWKDPEQPRAELVKDFLKSLKVTVLESTSPIVVHGQPGHGKTSAMRMLAQVKALDPEDLTSTILFYEFKNLGNLNSTWLQTLQRVTPFIKGEEFFHDRETILILDGMDERQITDGDDQNLGNFIRDIFLLSEKVNKKDDSRLNVVFTGRTLFVDQVKRYFISAYHQFEIADFTDEQVERWLTKYSDIKKLDSPITHQMLKVKHLDELSKQPILLTIASRVLADPLGIEMLAEVPSEEISRGRIYQIIISWTIRKEYAFEKPIGRGPEEEAYTRFLQMVAYVMFRKGEDAISLKNLAAELKKNDSYYQLEDVFSKEGSIVQIIKDLSVGFFFEGRDDQAFTFIHKSMKDYLVVEAMFTLLTEVLEVFNLEKVDRSCRGAAESIYFILGKQPLSYEDQLPFILDLLAQRRDRDFQKKLIAFFEAASKHQFLIKHEGGQNENPLITETNMLGALTYWIFGCNFEVIKLPNLKAILSITNWYQKGFRFFLNKVDFSENKYIAMGLIENLRGISLSWVFLAGAHLKEAYLMRANLRMANLEKANLGEANLKSADLRGADLESANLVDANLNEADLRGADLENANLRGADLEEVRHWESAIWEGTNIYGVKNAPGGFREFVLANGGVEEPPEG